MHTAHYVTCHDHPFLLDRKETGTLEQRYELAVILSNIIVV